MKKNKSEITIKVGLGTCGISAGAGKVYDAFKKHLKANPNILLEETSCNGFCHHEPLIEVDFADGKHLTLVQINPQKVPAIIEWLKKPQDRPPVKTADLSKQMTKQHRIVLENCGQIDPESLEEYLSRGGYQALRKAITEETPDTIIETMVEANLRGRGGAGFPTGTKWGLARRAFGNDKVVICNADEGDPGAFMDRAVLEGDPHRVVEGLAICAYAIGAEKAYVYIRAEYPLAVKRIRKAIQQAREKGFLGPQIMDQELSLEMMIMEGAGAFVCGEETALMASIEGKRGMPRWKPPYPAQSGLFGLPSNINNVETLATVPWIINHGAAAFQKIGTDTSKGTKIFSLAGNIKKTGLVEVEMGTPISTMIYDLGDGAPGKRAVKAVQMGGPSGGCLPASRFKTPVDYEALQKTGAIMGSGGIIVLDETSCMVEVARYFLEFTQNESCGKCTFCRIGTRRMLDILELITQGKGSSELLSKLERLATDVVQGSLCQLGKTAPNPVLTTLKFFREEYEEHIHQKFCRAGVCKSLFKYVIDPELCIGCGRCIPVCPVNAITGTPKQSHDLNTNPCTQCKQCVDICPTLAIRSTPIEGNASCR